MLPALPPCSWKCKVLLITHVRVCAWAPLTCVVCSSSRSPEEQAATDGCVTSVPWGDAGRCSQGLGDGISSALGSRVIRFGLKA